MNVADIAREAFDAVAAELDGVIKSCTLVRKVVGSEGYNVDTGEVNATTQQGTCRAVFARADAGSKYFPELVITAPEELVFLEGAQGMPPRKEDVLVVDGVSWRLTHPARDIVQGAGLWAAVVRAG